MGSTSGVEDPAMTSLVQSVLCKLLRTCSMESWTDVDHCLIIALLSNFCLSRESLRLDGLSFSLSALTKRLAARWFVSSSPPSLINGPVSKQISD